MRGQDRPMPCGVWAAERDLHDNTCPAVGEARRGSARLGAPADYKVLGGLSAALHNVTNKLTVI
jgi:hypothetical protein